MKKFKVEKADLPRGMRKGAYIFCFIMVIPAIYGIFRYVYINLNSILLAFSKGKNGPFVDGFTLDWFKLFFEELSNGGYSGEGGSIKVALANTLKYFGIGMAKLFVCYFIAYFLYKKIPGTKLFTVLFFFPCLVSAVISVNIFKVMIDVKGPIYNFLESLGFSEPFGALLKNPDTATNTVLIHSIISGMGTSFLILLGSMNRIPVEILESAKLDGCKSGREFFSIVLPLTWETFSVFLLMSTAMIFVSSGPILYFVGSENSDYNMTTIGYWTYKNVLGGNYYNYSAACGLFFTIVGIPIVVVTRWIANKLNAEVTY